LINYIVICYHLITLFGRYSGVNGYTIPQNYINYHDIGFNGSTYRHRVSVRQVDDNR